MKRETCVVSQIPDLNVVPVSMVPCKLRDFNESPWRKQFLVTYGKIWENSLHQRTRATALCFYFLLPRSLGSGNGPFVTSSRAVMPPWSRCGADSQTKASVFAQRKNHCFIQSAWRGFHVARHQMDQQSVTTWRGSGVGGRGNSVRPCRLDQFIQIARPFLLPFQWSSFC